MTSQNDVYAFLGDEDERENLLLRQKNYRAFEAAFSEGRERQYTDDRLGYVSMVEVDELCIAILGVNSAWLAEGGVDDEGKLLIGESQVQGAVEIAKGHSPQLILGLQHHPFELLQRFDRRPVQHRMEEACHFLHCGHLHDPEVKDVVVAGSRCVTITAGASFESRVARNTYTIVELDPLAGAAKVTFVQYNPQTSRYEYVWDRRLDFPIDGKCDCTAAELSSAIVSYRAELKGVSKYLAKLLLGLSSDVPLVTDGRIVFGNWSFVEGCGDASLIEAAQKFQGVGRAVRLLYGRRALDEILIANGEPIYAFGQRLKMLAEAKPAVEEYLRMQEEARTGRQAGASGQSLKHTVELLADMVRMDDWERARELAERTLDVSEGAAKAKVQRTLALCLGRSWEDPDKARAVELYRDVTESEFAEPGDFAGLAALAVELERHAEAREAVEGGIRRFPERSRGLLETGMRIVEATGDRGFRDRLLKQAEGGRR